MQVNDIDALTVHKRGTAVYEISTIYDGYFKHKLYIGYTRQQAISHFKKALKKGEI